MTENKFLNYLSKKDNINPAVLNSMIKGNGQKGFTMITWNGEDKSVNISSEIAEDGAQLSYHRIQDCFKNSEDLFSYSVICNLDDIPDPINCLGRNITDEVFFSLEDADCSADFVFLNSLENSGENSGENVPVIVNVRKDSYIPSILKENEVSYFKKGLYFLKGKIVENDIIYGIYITALIKGGNE